MTVTGPRNVERVLILESMVYSDTGVMLAAVGPVPFLFPSTTTEFVGDAPALALESMLALAVGAPVLEDRLAAAVALPPETEALPAPLVAADPPPVPTALETEFAVALGEPPLPTDAVPELDVLLWAVPVPDTLAAPLTEALAESEDAAASDPGWLTRSSVTGDTAKTSARLLTVAIKARFDRRFGMRFPFYPA